MEEKIDLSKKINQRLENEHVKMRSRWFFIVEKLGLEGALLLSILLSTICFVVVLYVMQQNGVFEFIEFGFSGLIVVIKNIPFDILAVAFLFIFIANIIVKQFDLSYRKPFYIFSCAILSLITVFSFLSYWTGLTHAIFNDKSDNVVANIYQKKITHMPSTNYAIIGKIVESKDNVYLLRTPQNQLVMVRISEPNTLSNGQIVKLMGTKTGNHFTAEKVSVIKNNPSRYFKITIINTPTPIATNSN